MTTYIEGLVNNIIENTADEEERKQILNKLMKCALITKSLFILEPSNKQDELVALLLSTSDATIDRIFEYNTLALSNLVDYVMSDNLDTESSSSDSEDDAKNNNTTL